MSYRVRSSPTFTRKLTTWGLSDTLLVEVHLRLADEMPGRLERTQEPYDGMGYRFGMIDPENRLREYAFFFHVVFSQDEEALIVQDGICLPKPWPSE